MSAASVVIIQRQIEDTSRPELTRTATFAIYDLVMTESRQCLPGAGSGAFSISQS